MRVPAIPKGKFPLELECKQNAI